MIPWNSVQTSISAAAPPAGAAAFIRCLRRYGARASGGRERSFVVREIGYFLDVLGMTNLVVRIENKDRSTFDSQLLDQSSVIRAEGPIFVVGEHFDLIYAKSSAPALLGEGKIHAEGIDLHVRQLAGFLVEPFGLRIADGGIQRWDHAENPDAIPGARQIQRFE